MMVMVEMVVVMPVTRAGDRRGGHGENEKSREHVGKRFHEDFLGWSGCNNKIVGAAPSFPNT
jgi:hypothetical protein